MFAESVSGAAARHRPGHGRNESPFPVPRQLHYERTARDRTSEELSPFVIGENGLLKVLPAPLSTAAASRARDGLLSDAAALDGDVAQKPRFGSRSPPKSNPTLRHAKYPFRDGRPAATKRASFTDRVSQHHDPADGVPASPERPGHHASGAAEARDRDLDNNRSTIFHDVDTPQHRTPAPPEDDSSSAPSQGDEATNQRTPRQPEPVAQSHPRQRAGKGGAGGGGGGGGLQESSLPRTSSRREKKNENRKRRLSLDYDDHALHSMSYSDLKKELFDHDPARVAVRAATVPTGDSIDEKLAYYKDKDENSQHHFFTQIPVSEWEACGDWFLEQFTGVMQKMRARRHEKRTLVAAFEAEIAERENTVRTKVENIERTLDELKQEGEVMMRGREVEM